MIGRLGLSEGLDTQVQGTNDDAQISKLSCTRAGYFQDGFVHHFVRKPVRRSPLINRGYYSRYAALHELLLQFLDTTAAAGQTSQVVVLGAGYDTAWFQLAEAGRQPTRYLELDFKQVTQRKVAIIQQQPALWSQVTAAHQQQQQQQQQQGQGQQDEQHGVAPQVDHTEQSSISPAAQVPEPVSQTAGDTSGQLQGSLPPPEPNNTSAAAEQPHSHAHLLLPPKRGGTHAAAPPVPPGMHVSSSAGELLSAGYSVLPVDLRDAAALQRAIQQAGLDASAPTYILSECVLVYMDPEASNQLLRWLASYFNNAVVVIYEQIKPNDAFGRQMMSNLELRGCPLRGLPATPTLQDHCRRLVSCGWPLARAWDMDAIYKWHLDAADKARVEALEVFDEFEEWHLIQEHYSISVGINSAEALTHTGFGPQGMATAAAQQAVQSP